MDPTPPETDDPRDDSRDDSRDDPRDDPRDASGAPARAALPDRAPEAASAPDKRQPLLVPRGLVMVAAIWVFVTWVLLFGIRPPIQPQAASYGPTLELLFASIGVGLSIGWPLLRLSSRPSASPVLQALFDGFALLVLLQVVIWPLRLVSSWTIPRMWFIVGALTAATMISAAILAAAQGSHHRRVRTMAMVLAAVLALLPLGSRIAFEWIAPPASDATTSTFDPAPARGDSAQGDAAPTRGPAPIRSPLLSSASGPVLLSHASAPLPLDPSPAEWALLRRAGWVALALWVLAIPLGRALRGDGGRPRPPLPLS